MSGGPARKTPSGGLHVQSRIKWLYQLKMTLVITTTLTLMALASPSLAQEEHKKITIPNQSLQSSLTAVGNAFELTIMAPSEIVRDKTAPALSGQFTADQALHKLLEGTGLEAKHTADGAVVIRKPDTPGSQSALSTNSPQNQAENGLRLQPVIVTGERTERTVFETASSVVAISGQDIDDTPSVREVDDLLKTIPNVDLGGNSNEGPTIRGVKAGGPLNGIYAFFGGSRPRMSTTVDGRAISYDEFIFGATSVWDVDHVEVFRGPQTTTQGVNSIAGAIHVVTADPTFEPEFKVLSELGDYKGARLAAVASGPIVENELAVRLSADFERSDSYLDMQPTSDYGPDPNTFLNQLVRGKVLWEPEGLPEMKMKLTLNAGYSTAPQAEYITMDNPKDRTPISTNMPSRSIEMYTGIHDVSYELSDAVKLSNTFTYTNTKSERHTAVASDASATSDRDNLSNETILNWDTDQHGLSGVVGLFYQRNVSDEYLNWTLPGKSYFDDTQTSLGLFTEFTYDITDKLDLTLGLRYQSDHQKRKGSSSGGRSYTVDMDYDKTFEALLPKFVLGYDVNENNRIGVMVTRGFNPGGITLIFTNGETNRFDEETVWNYELFARSSLLDNRMNLNFNAFYSDYSDYQMSYVYATVPFTVTGIANADEAVSYGMEFSVDYLVNEQIRLFSGLGLLKTEIKKYTNSGGLDVEGASFMRSPNITFSAGFDYSPIQALTLGATVRHIGKYKSEDTNDSRSAGDYTVVDCKVNYALSDTFTAYGYVNNLFNEFYTISELRSNRGIVSAPRDFGIGLSASF